MLVNDYHDLMPPTLITRDLSEIKEFRKQHGDVVMKPLYGNGGDAVFRVAKDDMNFGSLYDLFKADLPRSLGDPEISSRSEGRRQAHHSRRR